MRKGRRLPREAPAFVYRIAKQADKPDFVRAARERAARDSHSSRRAIADALKLPTRRRNGGPALRPKTRVCLLGIAPGGGYRAGGRRRRRGALLPHRFTLT